MKKLKELRKLHKMTQTELGNKIGVTKSTLSMYENGVHEPDLETLKKLADIFGVPVDLLLDRPHDQRDEEDETWMMRERLRHDPDYRILFDAATTAKPEHLRAAAAVLRSLKGDAND